MMLYSDSTNLTVLANGKKAWVVYLTFGNIEGATRQSDKRHCLVPIAFLASPEANKKAKV
jgi:hypothetical protein